MLETPEKALAMAEASDARLKSGDAFSTEICMMTVLAAEAQTNYYSKSTGNLELPSTWGTNTDGTGTAPGDFSGGYFHALLGTLLGTFAS